MYWVAVGALIVGVVALVLGYRRNDRKLLAAAAVLLLVAGGAEDLVAGFRKGISEGVSGQAAAAQAPACEA